MKEMVQNPPTVAMPLAENDDARFFHFIEGFRTFF